MNKTNRERAERLAAEVLGWKKEDYKREDRVRLPGGGTFEVLVKEAEKALDAVRDEAVEWVRTHNTTTTGGVVKLAPDDTFHTQLADAMDRSLRSDRGERQ